MVVTSQNIIFKMSDFSALLLLQLVTVVSRMHSETRSFAKTIDFLLRRDLLHKGRLVWVRFAFLWRDV